MGDGREGKVTIIDGMMQGLQSTYTRLDNKRQDYAQGQ